MSKPSSPNNHEIFLNNQEPTFSQNIMNPQDQIIEGEINSQQSPINNTQQQLDHQKNENGRLNQELRDKPMTIPIQDLNQLRLQKKANSQKNIQIERQQPQLRQDGGQPQQQIAQVPDDQNGELKKIKQKWKELVKMNTNMNLPSLQGGMGKKGAQMIQIKVKFQSLLGRLLDLQTRVIANSQLQEMILNHFSPEYLRIWISSLSEYHTRPSNFSSSETEILLIGYISSVYRDKLLDPVDKPPSVVKTSYKLCEMIQRYFYAKQVNDSIQKACSDSWCAIYQNCLQSESIQSKEIILYGTLKNIVTGGGDKVAQSTAVFVLQNLLFRLTENNEQELIFSISNSFFSSIFTRNGLDTPSIIKCARHIVFMLHSKSIMNYISLIIEKANLLLISPNTQYKIKVAVCELLELIGQQFLEVTDSLVGSYHEQIIEVLFGCSKDKIFQVQVSAKQALVPWIKFQNQYEDLEQQKFQKQMQPDQLDDVDEFIQQKTSSPQINIHGARLNTRGSSKDDRKNISGIFGNNNKSNAWVQETRAKDFVKKKTGMGGGCQLIIGSQRRPISSYQNQNNQLKDQIFNQVNQSQKYINDNYKSADDWRKKQYNGQGQYEQEGEDFQDHIGQNRNVRDSFNERDSFNIQSNPQQKQNPSYFQQSEAKPPKFQNGRASNRVIAPIDTENVEMGDEFGETVDFSNEKHDPNKYLRSPQQQFKQADQRKNSNQSIQSISQEQIKKTRDKNSQLSDMWNNALEQADQGAFQNAFKSVLDSGDDIYLIRLMMRNKNGFKHLEKATQLQIIRKIIQLMQSNFLARLSLGFFKETAESGLEKSLGSDEQESMLEILHDMSEIKSDIGPQASQLFSHFQQSFTNSSAKKSQSKKQLQ